MSKAQSEAAKRYWGSSEGRVRRSEILRKYWSSPEARAKMSETQKKRRSDPELGARVSLALKKYNAANPDSLVRRGKSISKYWSSPEARAKQSQAQKKRWSDPAVKKKASRVHTERFSDPAEREKLSKAQKKRYSNPQERELQSKRMKEVQNRPEVQEGRRKALKKSWKDPEIREKRCQGWARWKRRLRKEGSSIERSMAQALESCCIEAQPQFPIAGYLLDFAIPALKLDIECDGEYWHQDKAKDRVRDEALQELGWTVLRFSESSIQEDVAVCANEVKLWVDSGV